MLVSRDVLRTSTSSGCWRFGRGPKVVAFLSPAMNRVVARGGERGNWTRLLASGRDRPSTTPSRSSSSRGWRGRDLRERAQHQQSDGQRRVRVPVPMVLRLPRATFWRVATSWCGNCLGKIGTGNPRWTGSLAHRTAHHNIFLCPACALGPDMSGEGVVRLGLHLSQVYQRLSRDKSHVNRGVVCLGKDGRRDDVEAA